ncbi:2OG-Fe(II) oxygenase family protein [Acetobacter conturbans]|uniref:2OG-Fe(II) oxygenase n=1 Tax=Acetobacter conturbans TaxID=1737472 RepID=A0ABX0K284_9PROT|nr:2OG-Fe(II) oxygenase [Acetobacter conturbans]NHN89277.1 2OG-Fe(II) oxygenase [Acetobacter conturbans]
MTTATVHPDFTALEAAPVCTQPFPHVAVEHFILPPDLAAIHASLPQMESGGSFPPESLPLSPIVQDLVRQMKGPELRDIIASKFGLDLHDAPTMLTLRGRTREKDGRIHCDSTAKRVTVLLYLNPPSTAFERQEGCLRLLNGPDDVEDYTVEVPPVNGTLLVFPNGPTTWHGHRQYVGPRYTIQLNYMETGAKARSELRRHKLSALMKKLPFAA